MPTVRRASETLSPVKTGSCQDPAAHVLCKPPTSSLNPARHPWKDSPQDWALGEAAAPVQEQPPSAACPSSAETQEKAQQAGGEESGDGQPTEGGLRTGLGGRAERVGRSARLLRGQRPETSPWAVGWAGGGLGGQCADRVCGQTHPAWRSLGGRLSRACVHRLNKQAAGREHSRVPQYHRKNGPQEARTVPAGAGAPWESGRLCDGQGNVSSERGTALKAGGRQTRRAPEPARKTTTAQGLDHPSRQTSTHGHSKRQPRQTGGRRGRPSSEKPEGQTQKRRGSWETATVMQAADGLAARASEQRAKSGGCEVPARSREAPQDMSQSEQDTRPSLGEPVTKAGGTHV